MKLKVGLFSLLFLLAAGVTSAAAQTRVVTDTVTDALTGDPVSGAQVLVPNTTIGTTTRDDGTFSLGVPTGGVSILVRQLGYRRMLLSVPASMSTITVQMEQDVLQLDEVVVTGQATGIERRNLANSVETLSSEEISRVPAASIEQQIVGKVAGANVQQNSGAPGGGVQVELRGVTSINAVAQPLYVIDGVIVSDVAIPSNINAVSNAAGGSNPSLVQDNQVNRIVDINPNDIESIEILKGPSAAAIYGSQASSGVIIITTRRGRAGRPQIDISQRFGTFDLANKLGFRTYETAQEVDDQFGAGTAAANNFNPNNNAFDLEQLLAGRNALSFETSARISGGNENTRYFVSALWKDDEGIMENTGFDKQSVRVNLDQAIGDRVNLQISTNLIRTLARRGISNNDNSGTSPYMVFPFTPNFVDLRQNADGTFPDNPFERSNPLQTLAMIDNDEEVWRFIASTRLEWDLIRSDRSNLKLLAVAGVDRFSQKNELLFPTELQFEASRSVDGLRGTSLLSNSDVENINLTGSAVYMYLPGGGNVVTTTSAGIQFNTVDLNTARITSKEIVPGQSNVNAATNVQVAEIRQRTENLGFYLQEEVLIDDRLLLTAGVRADQTSANTADDDLFFYPKAAASYRATVGSGVLEEIKFRVAYGESGNQPVFGDKFTPFTATTNIGGVPGFTVTGPVVTTELKPERQREIEGGFDATFAGGRAILEMTVYHRRVSDLILPRQLAPSTGFTTVTFNGGRMRVNGLDASLALVPVQTPNFNWVFRSTFSLNRSEITDLPVLSFLPANAGFGVGLGQFRIEQGESATQIVGSTPDGEMKVGDSNPDFRMSFSNDLSWGPFNVFGLFDWQQGSQLVNLTKLLYDFGSNLPDAEVSGGDRVDAFLSGDIRPYIEDATFLKLRELSASFELPREFVQGIWSAARYVRLTASGRNLITWTGYSGMDPEVSNFGNQAIGRNIDVAPFPRTRSFWFGFDIGF